MRFILLFTLLLNVAFADDSVAHIDPTDDDKLCEEYFPLRKDIQDLQKVLSHKQEPYYLYFEGKELEDLQTLKNCLDYSMCGKYSESIVDDSANYRVHIFKSMTPEHLKYLVKSCPVKDLAKKLVVRHKDQKGKKVHIKKFKPDLELHKGTSAMANPAIFHEPSQRVSDTTVEAVKKLLSQNKTQEAHKLILYTWGINLHGYELSYTNAPGSFAVTNHVKKTITYGTEWLKEPCDFIRMIRHEAEHVAQIKKANSCQDHNFDDHNNRERAAHLNDARFMKGVCANTEAGVNVRSFCLRRFRKNYLKP